MTDDIIADLQAALTAVRSARPFPIRIRVADQETLQTMTAGVARLPVDQLPTITAATPLTVYAGQHTPPTVVHQQHWPTPDPDQWAGDAHPPQSTTADTPVPFAVLDYVRPWPVLHIGADLPITRAVVTAICVLIVGAHLMAMLNPTWALIGLLPFFGTCGACGIRVLDALDRTGRI